MILQALVSYYETLAARGELPQPGWAPVKVSYVLNLDDQGDITTVVCIKDPKPSSCLPRSSAP